MFFGVDDCLYCIHSTEQLGIWWFSTGSFLKYSLHDLKLTEAFSLYMLYDNLIITLMITCMVDWCLCADGISVILGVTVVIRRNRAIKKCEKQFRIVAFLFCSFQLLRCCVLRFGPRDVNVTEFLTLLYFQPTQTSPTFSEHSCRLRTTFWENFREFSIQSFCSEHAVVKVGYDRVINKEMAYLSEDTWLFWRRVRIHVSEGCP